MKSIIIALALLCSTNLVSAKMGAGKPIRNVLMYVEVREHGQLIAKYVNYYLTMKECLDNKAKLAYDDMKAQCRDYSTNPVTVR